MERKPKKAGARTEAAGGRARLIETARRLFTERGAANVGINDVTDTAGVARMTLYNNFASKEALTVAVYRDSAQNTLRNLDAVIAASRTESGRVGAVFDHFGKGCDRAGFRGCSFIHASFQDENPHGAVYAVVQAYKRALRERIFGALDEGRKGRAELADQIVILLDGAVTEAYIKGVANPIRAGKRAAQTLLDAAVRGND
ncbi:MAG TPA: TetR/AcrR family transcriptional regulator [Rhodanobacteraceae bacterium]|nr:TetR/AcrR family transcriptional regulator [Rhodanobacteraceae bacterium]